MRSTTAALAAALTATVGLAAPATAAETIHIEAATPFDGSIATFESDLEGCEEGTVTDLGASIAGTPRFGVFNGLKEFACDDGGSFVVRLRAQFNEVGSTGTWTIVRGSDGYEDLHGSGTLVGIPFTEGEGITDVYDGTLRS